MNVTYQKPVDTTDGTIPDVANLMDGHHRFTVNFNAHEGSIIEADIHTSVEGHKEVRVGLINHEGVGVVTLLPSGEIKVKPVDGKKTRVRGESLWNMMVWCAYQTFISEGL